MSNVTYKLLWNFIKENPNEIDKIKNQYLSLLSNLTITDYLEDSIFLRNINAIKKIGAIVVGIINVKTEFEIIASGTLIFEPKIIRQGKFVGHIEDVVVAPQMRNKGIAKTILNYLKSIAKELNCYKVTLDCSEDLKDFYIGNDFESKGVQMTHYFM